MRDAATWVIPRRHSLACQTGCVIVACLNGEFTLKRYILKGEQVVLRPENEAFSDIPVSPKAEFEIWGVVIRSVRMF